MEIESDCLGHLRSAIARGALDGHSRRDDVTGEQIEFGPRFSGSFNPGVFRGSAGAERFLVYTGVKDYLAVRGCILGPRVVPFPGDCIDFSPSSHCPPPDVDGDGYSDGFESYYGSDPQSPLSIPELLATDEQRGTNICSDGMDNDGDGHADRPDAGCRLGCQDFGLTDACSDADGDGWLTYVEENRGSDPRSAGSTPEHRVVGLTCSDGVDNDLDGLADAADSQCL